MFHKSTALNYIYTLIYATHHTYCKSVPSNTVIHHCDVNKSNQCNLL